VSDEAYWILALVLGLVVAAVAVFLLETVLREVHRIERGAGEVWQAGKEVARNTSTTWLLRETSGRLDRLAEEANLHRRLLHRPPAAEGRPASRRVPRRRPL
jgi:uncharacterized protein HemY